MCSSDLAPLNRLPWAVPTESLAVPSLKLYRWISPLVWATASGELAKATDQTKNELNESALILYFRFRATASTVIPATSNAPLDGSGTWVTETAFT